MNENDKYHADFNSISKTMLTLFVRDREKYYHTYVTRQLPPRTPAQHMLAGTVLHAMILEDASIDDMVLCYPDSCLKSDKSLNGKPAAKFREDNPGAVCMKEGEYADVRSVVDSVMANYKLKEILQQVTGREQRHDAKIAGLDAKCKPDLERLERNRTFIWDLKFSPVVSSQAWKRTSKSLLWWLQDAHYSAVLEAAYGKPVEFKFVSCELTFPYRVVVRDYDVISRETGRSCHLRYMEQLAECYQNGGWEVDLSETVVLEPWDVPDAEEEMQPVESSDATEDFDFDHGDT